MNRTMKNIWAITKKELRIYFTTPIAYVVATIFLLLVGILFYLLIREFNSLSFNAARNPYYYQQLNINQMVYSSLFFWMSLFLLFLLSLLTMRLFSEEKKTGTDELLYTSPISINQIILGKYIASLILLTIILLLTGILSIFSFAYGNPELAPILSGYLGLFLMGAAFIAVGIFFSSLTENQIISAILTFGIYFLFLFLYIASLFTGGIAKDILNYISFFRHFNDMTRGILDTADIVYYLSFTFLSLFLTHSVIQSRRWR